MMGSPCFAQESGRARHHVHPTPVFWRAVAAINLTARALKQFGAGTKGEVDEVVALLFRERDKVCKDDQPVGQPPAAQADGGQLLLFETGLGRRGGGYRCACRFRIGDGGHRVLIS
jgi:hypothetical protein